MDNPFYATRTDIKEAPLEPRIPRWFWPLTVMTFILGTLIAAALKTETAVQHIMGGGSGATKPTGIEYLSYQDTLRRQQDTIENLQLRLNQSLEKGAEQGSPEIKALTTQLDQYRFLAGITPVTGPGISVTLRDSTKPLPSGPPNAASQSLALDYTIHDLDLQNIINELRAAGAEAFAVNEQRIVSTTAIRCVGPAIQVNGVPLTPPYVIRAIGDPATLFGALMLREGPAEQIESFDPDMIAVKKSDSLVLPSYNGSVTFSYCSPVKQASTTTSVSVTTPSNTSLVAGSSAP